MTGRLIRLVIQYEDRFEPGDGPRLKDIDDGNYDPKINKKLMREISEIIKNKL